MSALREHIVYTLDFPKGKESHWEVPHFVTEAVGFSQGLLPPRAQRKY